MGIHLVTSAAGYISTHLCESLLREDHEVYGLNNFRLGTEANLAQLRRYPNFHFVARDVSDAAALRAALPQLAQVDLGSVFKPDK